METKEGDQFESSLCIESVGLGKQLDAWGSEGKAGVEDTQHVSSQGNRGGVAVVPFSKRDYKRS